MAPMSRGSSANQPKPLTIRKKKYSTLTAKKHRFETFSERIGKLSIHPVRKTDVSRIRDYADIEKSYFRTTLDEWKEVNLSASFTQFVREIDSKCRTLPQLLHHQEQVAKILIEYVNKADALALEPILSLVAQFAHDLGKKFEVYFLPTISAVINVAAAHSDVEAIEWSFNCLAWLFKYLSQLLTPDLRPLYDLIAPILGRSKQKQFVVRFAAEAVSFLIKKAGGIHHKNPKPLRMIINHIYRDLIRSAEEQRSQYRLGIANLFSESIRGIQRGINVNGSIILREVLTKLIYISVEENAHISDWLQVLKAMLINIIHHTDDKGFDPILMILLDQRYISIDEGVGAVMNCMITLVFTAIGTRKASRIKAWPALLQWLSTFIQNINRNRTEFQRTHFSHILQTFALVINYCPIDILRSGINSPLELINNESWDEVYLEFCSLVYELDPIRFHATLATDFRKFAVSRWFEHADAICHLLNQVAQSDEMKKSPDKLPPSIQNDMKAAFKSVADSDRTSTNQMNDISFLCSKYFTLLEHFDLEQNAQRSIFTTLYQALEVQGLSQDSDGFDFVWSKGFLILAEDEDFAQKLLQIWPRICSKAESYGQNVLYVVALNKLLQRFAIHMSDAQKQTTEILITKLIANLTSPSHDLRLITLKLLDQASAIVGYEGEAIQLCLGIEQSPLTHEHARAIALNIRKLAATHTSDSHHEWIKSALPLYCFGILHIQFTSAWEAACDALEGMILVKGAEQTVVTQALAWLQDDSTKGGDSGSALNESDPKHSVTSEDFQCSNLAQLEQCIQRISDRLANAEMILRAKFGKQHSYEPLKATNNRVQALKVFNRIPQLAERKSRILVPVLLDWSLDRFSDLDGHQGGLSESFQEDENISEDEGHDSDQGGAQKWSRKDQRELLLVFSKFVNPSSLYRSNDVHSALMNLLCNGDAFIQKSALKALSIWKSSQIKRYEDNLNNLLDDSRFREEITTFLDTDSNSSIIQKEDLSQLMPIILRLLYGRIISRTSASTKHGGQHAKRTAVFRVLNRLESTSLSEFIAISLGPLDGISVVSGGQLNDSVFGAQLLSKRRQVGLLRLLLDLLEVLGGRLSPYIDRLMNGILFCCVKATRESDSSPAEDELALNADSENNTNRSIRATGLRCINAMFLKCDVNVESFGHVIYNELIKSRLQNLPIETAQGISIILKLFSTWSSSAKTARILFFDETILIKVAECLAVNSAKDEVKVFVLENIINNVLKLVALSKPVKENDENDSNIYAGMCSTLMSGLGIHLIRQIVIMLRAEPKRDCLEAGIKTLLLLEPYAKDPRDEKTIVEVVISLLRRPTGLVNFHLKGELLALLKNRTTASHLELGSELYEQTLKSVSDLFEFFKDAPSRKLTVVVFNQLAQQDDELCQTRQICEELNAYSVTRLNEPDFDRRLEAFRLVADFQSTSMNTCQWYPIIKNMLYFIQDNDEIAIRSGASIGLKRFIQVVVNTAEDSSKISSVIRDTLVPAIQRGLRHLSEIVRAEYVSLLSELVSSNWPDLQDLKCLSGPDDEASFFNNILHIHQHRRMRALKRLSTDALKISSNNMNRFCLPLIENYITTEDQGSQNLAAEAVTSYEKSIEALDWQRFRQLLNRWIIESSKLDSKLSIRVLGATSNALYNAHKRRLNADFDSSSTLAFTLPSSENLAVSLTKSSLGRIMENIHFKDESAVDFRILLAVAAVKLIMTLPEEHISKYLPAIIMDVCNVLRSRAQEARDLTRKTLAEMASVVGSNFFHFVIKQLRSSLQKGYQLHVLAYTVHSLLISVSTDFETGAIDYCFPDIMQVIIEDIFGTVGQEKEAKEYISQMREVKKKSLSYDSMEILGSMAALNSVMHLITPLEAQLSKPRPKTEKIQELLRRLREGLRRNPNIKSEDFLKLCYEILNRDQIETNTHSQSYLIISFAFDLLRRALNKHEELKTTENLKPFLTTLNEAIESANEAIQLSAIKLLISIIKAPLKEIDEKVESYLGYTKRILEMSSSTNTDLAQSALKLMAAILRERPHAMIKVSAFEDDIAYALERIKPDLQEPAFQGDRDRQVAAFNLLRAVLGKGVLMKEIYDVMEVVREVMITSSEHPIPSLSRSAYSQFVLSYFPEEGPGFLKQLDYLTSNLQYPHARGRQSVMEVIVFIITKMTDTKVQGVIMQFFLPLVVVLVSDGAQDCQQSAEALIMKSLERADKERTKLLKAQMQTWLSPGTDELWRQGSLICWKIYFQVHHTANEDAHAVLLYVADQLNLTATERLGIPEELQICNLQLILTICSSFPIAAFAQAMQNCWYTIIEQITHPSSRIASISVDLISLLLSDFAKTTANAQKVIQIPMRGSNGLQLGKDLAWKITSHGFQALRDDQDSKVLAMIVQILSFIGRASAGETNSELLQFLFQQAAQLARRESGTTPPRARVAVLKLVASWCNSTDVAALRLVAKDIILPLQNLTDSAKPSISSTDPDFAPVYEELEATAHELLAKLQTALGPSEFLSQVQAVQKDIRNRREERRVKRRIDAVSNPEKAEREKQKKHNAAKLKRRMKNATAAGKRRGY